MSDFTVKTPSNSVTNGKKRFKKANYKQIVKVLRIFFKAVGFGLLGSFTMKI